MEECGKTHKRLDHTYIYGYSQSSTSKSYPLCQFHDKFYQALPFFACNVENMGVQGYWYLLYGQVMEGEGKGGGVQKKLPYSHSEIDQVLISMINCHSWEHMAHRQL